MNVCVNVSVCMGAYTCMCATSKSLRLIPLSWQKHRMQKILQDNLEKQGYTVDLVWNMEEAVAALTRGQKYIVAIVGVDTDSPAHKTMPEGSRQSFPALITC